MINKSRGKMTLVKEIAIHERYRLDKKYNNEIMGKCIEATDSIISKLREHNYGIIAEAKQVWVLYENFESCSNYCYEERWLVKVKVGRETWYVDATMDQFQWAFSKKLPRIYIGKYLPKFYLVRKPGKTTLDKCGWNDWYNYGDYENN